MREGVMKILGHLGQLDQTTQNKLIDCSRTMFDAYSEWCKKHYPQGKGNAFFFACASGMMWNSIVRQLPLEQQEELMGYFLALSHVDVDGSKPKN